MKQRLTLVATSLALLAMAVSCGSATTPAPKPGPAAPPASAPARTQGQFTSGTVASIVGSTLTLTTAQGQVTMAVGAETSIQKTVAGTLADFREGQELIVNGAQNADGIMVATSITIRSQTQGPPRTPPAGATPRPPRTTTAIPGAGARRSASGTLTRIVSNTLTLTTAQGQVTVNVPSNTSIQKTDTGVLADIQEGESLTVIGSRDANGNIAATYITIRPPRQGTTLGP